jgi:hypothetical protein
VSVCFLDITCSLAAAAGCGCFPVNVAADMTMLQLRGCNVFPGILQRNTHALQQDSWLAFLRPESWLLLLLLCWWFFCREAPSNLPAPVLWLQNQVMPQTLPDGRTESPGVLRIYMASMIILAAFYACSATLGLIFRVAGAALKAVGIGGEGCGVLIRGMAESVPAGGGQWVLCKLGRIAAEWRAVSAHATATCPLLVVLAKRLLPALLRHEASCACHVVHAAEPIQGHTSGFQYQHSATLGTPARIVWDAPADQVWHVAGMTGPLHVHLSMQPATVTSLSVCTPLLLLFLEQVRPRQLEVAAGTQELGWAAGTNSRSPLVA